MAFSSTFRTPTFHLLGIDPTFKDRYEAFHSKYAPDSDPEILSEGLHLLMNDPVIFIEMCIKVISSGYGGQKKIMLFELWEEQKVFVRLIYKVFKEGKKKGVVCCKSRQQGASWLITAFALHSAIFEPFSTIGFTSVSADYVHKIGNYDTLMGKINFFLDNLPPIAKKLIVHRNLKHFNYEVNQSLISGFVGAEGARSTTPDLLINDEFAFNPNAQSLMAGSVPSARCLVFVSTLNHPNSEFDRLRRNDMYEQVTLDWRKDPRIKEDAELWRLRKIKELNGDETRFDREYDMQYNISGVAYLVPPEVLKYFYTFRLDSSYRTGRVIAGLDVAGMGTNYNVLYIRQGACELDVHRWRGLQAFETVEKVVKLASQYNISIVCFDEIGVGMGVASEFNRYAKGGMLPFKAIGLNMNWSADQGDSDRQNVYINEPERKVYKNLRAKLYWQLARRMRLTYQAKGKPLLEDAIEVKTYAILNQLSPMTFETENGKIQIMSKRRLKVEARARGIHFESPDELDACMLSFGADEGERADACLMEYYKKYRWV